MKQGRHGVCIHRQLDCLFNRLFWISTKKTLKLCIAFLSEGIHWWPVDSPHKGPVIRKCPMPWRPDPKIRQYLVRFRCAFSPDLWSIRHDSKSLLNRYLKEKNAYFLRSHHSVCWWPRNARRYSDNHAPAFFRAHYSDVIMTAMTSQITSLTVVHSIVYSDADQRKHQSSALLAFVWGIHRWPVNSPHKGSVNVPIWWRHYMIGQRQLKHVKLKHGNVNFR